MKFCCIARAPERASRRQTEPNGNNAVADFAIPRPEARGSDAESLHQALLNPHRSLDSCGVGINFRITENGELEIESLAPTGMVAFAGVHDIALAGGCAPQAWRRRHGMLQACQAAENLSVLIFAQALREDAASCERATSSCASMVAS